MVHREKPTISITLPKHIHEWVEREAKRNHRSRSQMIALVIEEAIRHREKQSGDASLFVNEEPQSYARPVTEENKYAPSPLEVIIRFAREGIRSLGIDPAKPAQANFEYISAKFPELLRALSRLARQTTADPNSIQPFDERLWPYTQKELYALRDVYSLIWRRQHS